MNSTNFIYLGGLKKCVIKKFFFKLLSISDDNSSKEIPDVLDVKICLSMKGDIFLYKSFFQSNLSAMTSIIQSHSFNFSR